MKPSHLLLDSPYFQYRDFSAFAKALGDEVAEIEVAECKRLDEKGLPPITSRVTLAALIGVSPGLIWSFCKRTNKHYRSFNIPKGSGLRKIDAPRVALKLVQKWLSFQLAELYIPSDHVFGFVSGRSHLDAANVHVGARWIFSVDIENFFQTTPRSDVESMFLSLGYNNQSAELLSQLVCLNEFLAQGSPASPIISNLCMLKVDADLVRLARQYEIRVSRYADDIVFSGVDQAPVTLLADVRNVFSSTPWTLSEKKIEFSSYPKRLKVHGLLVHGDTIRLTKGYRNRLRAYAHLNKNGLIVTNTSMINGHLQYGKSVSRLSKRDRF